MLECLLFAAEFSLMNPGVGSLMTINVLCLMTDFIKICCERLTTVFDTQFRFSLMLTDNTVLYSQDYVINKEVASKLSKLQKHRC